MKQIVKESIDILRKCGYIVETMNTISDSDDDLKDLVVLDEDELELEQ